VRFGRLVCSRFPFPRLALFSFRGHVSLGILRAGVVWVELLACSPPALPLARDALGMVLIRHLFGRSLLSLVLASGMVHAVAVNVTPDCFICEVAPCTRCGGVDLSVVCFNGF